MGVLTGQGRTYVLGSFAGFTKSKVARLIEDDAGGKTTDDYTKSSLTRVICSPALWAQATTQSISLILKAVMRANKDNAEDADDPHQNRVWILPLEWLQASIAAGELLHEEEYDYEVCADQVRRDRAKVLREERKANGGRSLFANRKDRINHGRAQQLKEIDDDEEIIIVDEEEAMKRQLAQSAIEARMGAGIRLAGGGGGPAYASGSGHAASKLNSKDHLLARSQSGGGPGDGAARSNLPPTFDQDEDSSSSTKISVSRSKALAKSSRATTKKPPKVSNFFKPHGQSKRKRDTSSSDESDDMSSEESDSDSLRKKRAILARETKSKAKDAVKVIATIVISDSEDEDEHDDVPLAKRRKPAVIRDESDSDYDG